MKGNLKVKKKLISNCLSNILIITSFLPQKDDKASSVKAVLEDNSLSATIDSGNVTYIIEVSRSSNHFHFSTFLLSLSVSIAGLAVYPESSKWHHDHISRLGPQELEAVIAQFSIWSTRPFFCNKHFVFSSFFFQKKTLWYSTSKWFASSPAWWT